MIRKGTIAICSLGAIGMITEDHPIEVTYRDGNKGFAYVGIQLTNKLCSIGKPWSSRNPKIIGHIDNFTSIIENIMASSKENETDK